MFTLAVFADSNFADQATFTDKLSKLVAGKPAVKLAVMVNKASGHLESMVTELCKADHKFTRSTFMLADLPNVLGKCDGWVVFTDPTSSLEVKGKRTARGYTVWNINAANKHAMGKGRIIPVLPVTAKVKADKPKKSIRQIQAEIRAEFAPKADQDAQAVFENASFHQVGAALGELLESNDHLFSTLQNEFQRYMLFEHKVGHLPGLETEGDYLLADPATLAAFDAELDVEFDATLGTDDQYVGSWSPKSMDFASELVSLLILEWAEFPTSDLGFLTVGVGDLCWLEDRGGLSWSLVKCAGDQLFRSADRTLLDTFAHGRKVRGIMQGSALALGNADRFIDPVTVDTLRCSPFQYDNESPFGTRQRTKFYQYGQMVSWSVVENGPNFPSEFAQFDVPYVSGWGYASACEIDGKPQPYTAGFIALAQGVDTITYTVKPEIEIDYWAVLGGNSTIDKQVSSTSQFAGETSPLYSQYADKALLLAAQWKVDDLDQTLLASGYSEFLAPELLAVIGWYDENRLLAQAYAAGSIMRVCVKGMAKRDAIRITEGLGEVDAQIVWCGRAWEGFSASPLGHLKYVAWSGDATQYRTDKAAAIAAYKRNLWADKLQGGPMWAEIVRLADVVKTGTHIALGCACYEKSACHCDTIRLAVEYQLSQN